MYKIALASILLLGLECSAANVCILTLGTAASPNGRVITLLETCDGSKLEIVASGTVEMMRNSSAREVYDEIPAMLSNRLNLKHTEGLRPVNHCEIKTEGGFLSQGVGLYCLLARP